MPKPADKQIWTRHGPGDHCLGRITKILPRRKGKAHVMIELLDGSSCLCALPDNCGVSDLSSLLGCTARLIIHQLSDIATGTMVGILLRVYPK